MKKREVTMMKKPTKANELNNMYMQLFSRNVTNYSSNFLKSRALRKCEQEKQMCVSQLQL